MNAQPTVKMFIEEEETYPTPNPSPPANDNISYHDSTYNIVSRVAYLIGVGKNIFENENEPPKLEIYEELDKNKHARIIRHLCIVRNSIWRAYKHISNKMRIEHRDIRLMEEYIPADTLAQLRADGVDFAKKGNTKAYQHIIELNRLVSDRINNCKDLFPLWINWNYIKELFIVPNGMSEYGTKDAADTYYANRSFYPYQMYINWTPSDEGNILYCDKKFATLLYKWHNDEFTEYSKVSDVSSYVKGNIYEYILDGEKTVVLVDCENADPYKLCAVFKNLDSETMNKISSIVLVDDVHTSSAWRILERFTPIPVKHLLIERVKNDKSLVDISLTVEACREFFQNDADSFIIVSSDSDYWGLIHSLSDARFLVMVERDKCGPDIKNALVNRGIFYCYLDDFYAGNADDLKHSALFMEMYRYIDDNVKLNLYQMLDDSLRATRITMTDAERAQFVKKYFNTLQVSVDIESGNVELSFKHKRDR